jgi:hypothetical protein
MKLIRAVAIAALVFLGITSLVGAVPLIVDPTGRMLSMPLSLLEHSPFSSFLIPGIILLAANCLLSFWVLAKVLRRMPRYGNWIALQGCVLAGWITVQIVMIRTIIWAHHVYLVVSAILIFCGWLLRRDAAGGSFDKTENTSKAETHSAH